MLNTLTLDIRHFAPAPVEFKPLARFTRDGSDELERHLERICKKVLAGVQRIFPADKLAGLALGGGYGRGEGGVLKTASGDQPYNDIEFYIFVRGPVWWNERRHGSALNHLAEELSRVAGIEVEFKITSAAKFRRSPPSMFFHDLVLGHVWLIGDDGLLDGCEHHRHASRLPTSEAARLLMNRCTGLLFAREKLEREHFTSDDADFVFRNMAKAKLALGDAVLTMFGKYHWSCVERHRRLRKLSAEEKIARENFQTGRANLVCRAEAAHCENTSDPLCTSAPLWLEYVMKFHAEGVEFKLHPRLSAASRDDLAREHRNIRDIASEVWLWVENRRLDQSFASIREYATSSINKFPKTNPWRNLLANLRAFGLAAITNRQRLRHPREKIVNALALLLWAGDSADWELSLRESKRKIAFARLSSIAGYRAAWRRSS